MTDDRWWIDASPEFRQRVMSMLIDWARNIAPQNITRRACLPHPGPKTDAIEPAMDNGNTDELERAWGKLVALEAKSTGRDSEPDIVVRITRRTIDRIL